MLVAFFRTSTDAYRANVHGQEFVVMKRDDGDWSVYTEFPKKGFKKVAIESNEHEAKAFVQRFSDGIDKAASLVEA